LLSKFPHYFLSDIFPDYFSFHVVSYSDTEAKIAHIRCLNNIYESVSLDSKTTLVITDASLKDNKVVTVAYVYKDRDIHKIKQYTMNVTTTESDLFAIRCGITRALSWQNTNYIIVITDIVYAAKKIFDISCYFSNFL